MKMKYKVKITEYSSKIVEIELSDEYDEGDVLAEIMSDYYEGALVLDFSDFDDVEFEIYND
jgi:hypothetical protein